MTYPILDAAKDPMGAAIADYHRYHRSMKLRVLSSMFEEDEIPLRTLFRTWNEMPRMEQLALRMARGRVLDAGAGSGCHTLALQELGLEVTALDISPLSVRTMRERGVRDARLLNLFDPQLSERFDTILLLMNGSGVIGRLSRIDAFFARMRTLLQPGGQILMDSSDLKYLYENEDGTYDIDPTAPYYGEVDYRMMYSLIRGEVFEWLYLDFDTLRTCALRNGFEAELVMEGEHYDYLARLCVRE